MPSIVTSLIKGFTLGIIQFEEDPDLFITIKDPVTGIMNIGKDLLNTFRDFNKGVWIGKKPLQIIGIGLNSLALEYFGINGLHYCFRIQGQSYQLEQGGSNFSGKKNNEGTIKLAKMIEQKNTTFQWFYKGPLQRSISQVEELIDYLNKMKQKYCLMTKNCQHFSKAICLYARGIFTKGDVVYLLFDKQSADKIISHYGLNLTVSSIAELGNVFIKIFYDFYCFQSNIFMLIYQQYFYNLGLGIQQHRILKSSYLQNLFQKVYLIIQQVFIFDILQNQQDKNDYHYHHYHTKTEVVQKPTVVYVPSTPSNQELQIQKKQHEQQLQSQKKNYENQFQKLKGQHEKHLQEQQKLYQSQSQKVNQEKNFRLKQMVRKAKGELLTTGFETGLLKVNKIDVQKGTLNIKAYDIQNQFTQQEFQDSQMTPQQCLKVLKEEVRIKQQGTQQEKQELKKYVYASANKQGDQINFNIPLTKQAKNQAINNKKQPNLLVQKIYLKKVLELLENQDD